MPICDLCHGNGNVIKKVDCSRCNGTGQIKEYCYHGGTQSDISASGSCPLCNDQGYYYIKCPDCDGNGFYSKEETCFKCQSSGKTDEQGYYY